MKLSIITVNYRQPEATLALLRSIARQSFRDMEVIVIDNSPLADFTDAFIQSCPGVRVQVNQDNVGFAAANNQGMALARGRYFFLLNNDTEVCEGFFSECLKPFSDPNVGAVSPLICYHEQPDLIQYAGFTNVNILGQNRTVGNRETDLGQFVHTVPTPYAHGAAMLIRREVWLAVGGMPEDFFLYYEELAWSVKIRQAGYQILFHPAAKVLHKASLSTGRESLLKTYYLNRNRLQFMWRYETDRWRRLAFTAYFLLAAFPLHWCRYIQQGRKAYAKVLKKAVTDAISGRFGYQTIS